MQAVLSVTLYPLSITPKAVSETHPPPSTPITSISCTFSVWRNSTNSVFDNAAPQFDYLLNTFKVK